MPVLEGLGFFQVKLPRRTGVRGSAVRSQERVRAQHLCSRGRRSLAHVSRSTAGGSQALSCKAIMRPHSARHFVRSLARAILRRSCGGTRPPRPPRGSAQGEDPVSSKFQALFRNRRRSAAAPTLHLHRHRYGHPSRHLPRDRRRWCARRTQGIGEHTYATFLLQSEVAREYSSCSASCVALASPEPTLLPSSVLDGLTEAHVRPRAHQGRSVAQQSVSCRHDRNVARRSAMPPSGRQVRQGPGEPVELPPLART